MKKTSMKLKLIMSIVLLTASLFIIFSNLIIVGADNNLHDDPVQVITNTLVDLDNNYIIAGQTLNENIYISKYDPNGQIIWEHFMGGSGSDIVETLRVDGSNNLIIVGETWSSDFALTQNTMQMEYGGSGDIFVMQISSSGKVMWATYFGGSSRDQFLPYNDGVLISENNQITIWGNTYSSDLQVSQDAFQKDFVGGDESTWGGAGAADGFVAHFSPDGSLSWSTYLGGTGLDIIDIRFDNEQNLIVGAETASPDYPVYNAFQENYGGGSTDMAVTKFFLDGEVQWSTFLGGTGGETFDPADMFRSIEFDDQNNIIVHGLVSDNFPTTTDVFQPNYGGGTFDWSISKISPDGGLIWSTFLGGFSREGLFTGDWWVNGEDMDAPPARLGSIVQDDLGNIIMLGQTISPDYPMHNAFQDTYQYKEGLPFYDIVLTKLNPNGNVIFSTFLGGIDSEWEGEIFVDSENNIIVTGETDSDDFPTKNGAQETFGGFDDVFVSKFTPDGDLLWSTYLGGSKDETLIQSSLDSNNDLLVLGITNSQDFPVTDNSEYLDLAEGFITKINSNGKISWSSYLAANGTNGFNRFSLQIDNSDNAYITGTTTTRPTDDLDDKLKTYITKVDTDGNLDWSQEIGESIPQNSNFPILIATIIISTLMAGILYGVYIFNNSRKIEDFLLTPNMNQILEPVFDNKPSLVYVFIGKNMIEDRKLESKLRSSVPKGLLEFKFLLHPIKLSMMKVLHESMNVSTVELRQELGISWNEFNYHLNQLKKKGYVRVEVDIVDHSFKNVITLETQGIEEFKILQSLLIEFVNSGPDISRYIKQIDSLEKRTNVDELYPKDSKK